MNTVTSARPDLQSPFAVSYETLACNGYHVIPIGPHTKAPSEYRSGKWWPMREWQKFRAVAAPAHILRFWSQWQDCNIGVLTGTPAGEGFILACVDFDADDFDVLEELQSSIPHSPVQKKGRRGYSAFYRVASGTVGFRTELAELLTDTRQTVIPPSIHPDTGMAYQWTGTKTLDDVRPEDLPVLNEDDIERFRDTLASLIKKPLQSPRPVLAHASDPNASIWRQINTRAYNELSRWVPDLGLPKLQATATGYKAVAHWRASTTGRLIAQRSQNLSIMAGLGARDFGSGESYTALNLVAAALSLTDDQAFQWLGERLGLVEALPLHDLETGEIIEPPKLKNDNELPESLTNVPGLLGEMVNWICASNRKPNKTLALGTALTVLGTIVGQAIAGPTGSATHLYLVCVGPSGIGKEYPKTCCSLLLEAANAAQLIGPSDFKSSSGLVNFLKRKPVALCAVDEMGMMLNRILGPNAKAHDSEISSLLRELWGKNFTTYRTPEWAAVQSVAIDAPALSFYGCSTLEELFAAMGGKDVMNGFLNRWLILPTERRSRGRPPAMRPNQVPKVLGLRLAECRIWAHRVTDDMINAPIGSVEPKKQLRWGHGAESLWSAFEAEIFELEGMDQAGVFYARSVEIALRLATIRAAGRLSETLDQEDFIWGRELAMWASMKMKALAQGNIAENDTQRLHNKIVNIIFSNGGMATHSHIVQKLRGSVKSRDIKDICDNLMSGGTVSMLKTIPPAGGTPTLTYKLVAA